MQGCGGQGLAGGSVLSCPGCLCGLEMGDVAGSWGWLLAPSPVPSQAVLWHRWGWILLSSAGVYLLECVP